MSDWLSQLTPGLHDVFGITVQHKPWNTWAKTCQSPLEGSSEFHVRILKWWKKKKSNLCADEWLNVCWMWQVPVHHWPGQVLVRGEASLLLPEQMQWISVFSLHSGTVGMDSIIIAFKKLNVPKDWRLNSRSRWCFTFPLSKNLHFYKYGQIKSQVH